jgi:hypothetical protein
MPVEPVELLKLIIGLIILTVPGYIWSYLFSRYLSRLERILFGFLSGLAFFTIASFALNILFHINITQPIIWVLYIFYFISVLILYLFSIRRYIVPKITLKLFKNKTVILLAVILCFSFFMVFLLHLSNNYYLAFHVDEWEHWRYTQGFQQYGSITFLNPYTGAGTATHPEVGFHITTAVIQWISTSTLQTIFLFMPALIGVLLSLMAFIIGQRSERKFGLEAAFLVAFIPTSARFLGPSFYVPSTLGLLLILFIIWLMQLKKIQGAIAIPFFIFYLFIVHPTTALAAIGIILVYAVFLVFEKEYRLALLTALLCIFPMVIVVLFTNQWNTIIEFFITSVTGTKYPIFLNLPRIMVSFMDLGLFTWGLLIIGVYFAFIKGKALLRTLSIAIIAFIIVIGLYDKFGYGFPGIYERMFLYLFLLVALIAGFGLSEIRRILTDLLQKQRFNAMKNKVKRLDILVPVALGIVVLLIALPAHLSTPYYKMISEHEYETFTWIHDHINDYRDANHSYSRAAVDPEKASPFTVVTGVYTISSSMSPLYGYELHTKMEQFLQEKCVNTSFLNTFKLSVIYGDATNANLTKIHENVYLYPALPET